MMMSACVAVLVLTRVIIQSHIRHRLGRCAKRKKDEVPNQAEKIAVSRSVGDAGQRNRDSGRGIRLFPVH